MRPPLPRPDALRVRPVAAHAVVPPEAAQALFGAPLRGSERAHVVRLGRIVASVPVVAGPTLRLVLDASLDVPHDALRLAGPQGAVPLSDTGSVRARLVVPAALGRAWGLGETAVVALGPVAVRVPVEAGPDAGVDVDRALWIAAGRPETARWLPQTDWQPPTDAPADGSPRVATIPRRVVTETDVRQARLHRRTIALTPGQIVTPAAATLAREWGVFGE